MSRGPAPTPTNILALRGSWRATDRLASGEPSGTPLDTDSPPAELPPMLHTYWSQYVPAARSLGVMTIADIHAMMDLCRLSQLRDVAWEDICKNGICTHGENGGEYQRPCVGTFNQAVTKISALLQQFGMTPAARTRVRVAVAEKPSGVRARKAAGT